MKFLAALLLMGCLLQGCVDAIVPEYDYETGFLLVEGSITAGRLGGRVSVRRSEIKFGDYWVDPVADARVYSVDEAGQEVAWPESIQGGEYVAPEEFEPVVGQRYYLRIQLPSGEFIESEPEVMPPQPSYANLRLTFDQESYYSNSRERFVPAFTLLVDLDDPPEGDYFLQFTYRTWSQTSVCYTCRRSVYRNGICVQTFSSSRVDRYDYLCSSPCWSFTDGEAFQLLSNEFNSGGQFENVPAARIDFAGSGKLLAEVRLSSISRKAFAYQRVLQGLTEGSAGLNAPLPAPLYGNLTDLSDLNTPVLGFVGTANVFSDRLLWNRDTIQGSPIFAAPPPFLEPIDPEPPRAPCTGPNRTTVQPEGWNG